MQSAIAGVLRRLPDNVMSPPTYRKANPADAPILLLAVHSPTLSLTDVDALAENVIAPALSTIDGVAQAQVFGSQTYAVRIDVDPNKLAARGLGLDQVYSAIAAANNQTPLGTLQTADQSLTINAPTQLTNADAFRSLIIATPSGNPVRLGDVATVYDSVKNLEPEVGSTASRPSCSPSCASRAPTPSASSMRSWPGSPRSSRRCRRRFR